MENLPEFQPIPKELSNAILKIRFRCREAVEGPGKFEGESTFVPFMWDRSLDGCCDSWSFENGGGCVVSIPVSDEDRVIFPELAEAEVIWLYEDSNGFVVEVDELEAQEIIEEIEASYDEETP